MNDIPFGLETKRLWLRPMAPSDADALELVLADPVTMEFYPAPFDRAQVEEWITKNLKAQDEEGLSSWAVVLKATGKVVGDCGPVRRELKGVSEVEIGWHIRQDVQRKGLATEAGMAARTFCFKEKELDRVISLIRPENLASQKVAEHLGMHVERQIKYGTKKWVHDVWAIEKKDA